MEQRSISGGLKLIEQILKTNSVDNFFFIAHIWILKLRILEWPCSTQVNLLAIAQRRTEAMFTLYRLMKRASVHTRDATFGIISALEQDYFAPFLKDVIPATLRTVDTVPDQFLRRSVSLFGTV